jgi:hypothetical protein
MPGPFVLERIVEYPFSPTNPWLTIQEQAFRFMSVLVCGSKINVHEIVFLMSFSHLFRMRKETYRTVIDGPYVPLFIALLVAIFFFLHMK